MKTQIRYTNHPDDVKRYQTDELRKKFLVEKIFINDDITLVYSHQDRIVFGGIKPVSKTLELKSPKELASDYFLQRREIGIINIGGDGEIEYDGKKQSMKARDGIYLGRGIKKIKFKSLNKKEPAKFYYASTPAHMTYPTVHIPFTKTNPRKVGSEKEMNKRVINQYLHKSVLDTCSLQMGLTILEEGSGWNTMPTHTHERRAEVYIYFDFPEEHRVFHLMGTGDETRHIVMAPDQAVISPSWSIHAGIGTTNYTFIWAMSGENQDYDDMQHIKTKDLK